MTSIIIKSNSTGETQVVADLTGYDETEWDVLAIDREPLPNEVWDEQAGAWVLDDALVQEQAEKAETIDPERLRAKLRAMLGRISAVEDETALIRQQATSQIQSLNSTVAALEARITALETTP